MKLEDLQYSMPSQPVDEKNFNIEKWREENPVDYFKCIYLLEQMPGVAKDVAFQSIYKVMRLYLPDTLYKYYSLGNDQEKDQLKLETLQKQQVYLSDIASFNDPFDSKAYYYDPGQLKDIPRLKRHGGRLIDDFTAFIRATSLTANGVQSMPMWAHYANNHAGFCVSYDTKHNVALSSCTFPVQYTDQRLDITSLMIRQAQLISSEIDRQSELGKKEILIDDLSVVYMSSLLCNIKHSSWSYEKEFRCTMGKIAPGMPYVDAKPDAIYAGMKCSESNLAQLKQIATMEKIPIYQMWFDELSSSYELQIRNIL